nr:hypothetical protein [Tanacetum cinerariifolium]
QIESWSLPALLLQLLNDSRTIDEMLKQHEQAANLVVQKEQEEQAVQSFIPYWNFSMIDDEEVLQSSEKFLKAIQTFLQKFRRYSFRVMPNVLLIAWERFYEIKHAFIDKQCQPEEIQKLMCKLLEDVRNLREELAEYINSPSWNRLTFYNDDEEHSIQYKEYLENSSNAIAPVLQTEEPQYSLSMGYEHLSTIPKTESDEVIKSSVKNLVQIPREYEDVEYIEASELISLEEENDVHQEEKEFDLEDILQIQDVILLEKLLCINRLIAEIEFLNDNPTPDHVLKSSFSIPNFEKSDNYLDNSLPEFKTFSDHTLTSVFMKDISDNSTNDPLLEEVDLFLASDNSIPSGIENNDYDSEGDIYFLKELLVDDSIPLLENESSNFDHHDDPSFPRPPPELPDVELFFDFEPNSGEVISAVINNIAELNEDECFDPRGEIDVFANIEDDDYFPFIFVIRIFLPYLIYHEDFPHND